MFNIERVELVGERDHIQTQNKKSLLIYCYCLADKTKVMLHVDAVKYLASAHGRLTFRPLFLGSGHLQG